MTKKVELGKVGIVGLGGTGSYILDLLAKTPVREIHIFDNDKFSQHNAFRSPGAPSIEKLREEPKKVSYFQQIYSAMHRNIIKHECFIDETNIDTLGEMDFVFLCLDKGSAKAAIIDGLENFETPFIDVGMGLTLENDALGGILRVTTSTKVQRDHIRTKQRISFADGKDDDAYRQNIQIAELNALNAALAVIKWKKLLGFYRDLENEYHSTYTLDVNLMVSDDQYEPD